MIDSTTRTLKQWAPGNVTEHFQLREWTCPAMYGLPAVPYPLEWVPDRLLPLCKVLEVLRAQLGNLPVEVMGEEGGGYRTEDWNAAHIAAGHDAAPHSQHIQGTAADIRVGGVDPAVVHSTLLQLHNAGKIRIGGLGLYRTFVHVDIRQGDHLAMWTEPARDVPAQDITA